MSLGESPRRRVTPAVHQEALVQAKEIEAVKTVKFILMVLRVQLGLQPLIQTVQLEILSLEAVILQDGQIILHY